MTVGIEHMQIGGSVDVEALGSDGSAQARHHHRTGHHGPTRAALMPWSFRYDHRNQAKTSAVQHK